MARSEADRNLLFGILALQMDFIGRDDLVAAMNAWVLQKHRPLEELLEERGALAAVDRALLESLVRRHIEQHGDDPARSLAAVGSADGLRGALRSTAHADPDLEASLAAIDPDYPLTGAADPPRDWPSTIPPGPSAATDRAEASGPSGGRFRVLGPHASGGLGDVFLAHDEELHREVALKQIQERYADHPHLRSRFLLEAEVTGRLEHPGIVPVYSLGAHEDGRPYYAMRFIRGTSMKEAIERFHRADLQPGRDPGERAMALRGLLRPFVHVCSAVAYAHSRGVLHRDLKPDNIMLGPYDETLVVDWGLAKPIGRPEQEGPVTERTLRPSSGSGLAGTQMGSAIGTPAFMSPEQAAGRLDELGPASDVYSLGAILYHLLAGRVPFEGPELGDVLRRVRAGDFPPPRQVNDAVPAGLEAVCLKAMALEPGGRYTSPTELARDVDRWLADEPVTAWREPLSIRARRWLGRHRTLMASSLAFLLTAVIGLSISAVFLGWEQRRTEAAHREAVANAERAEQQARIAHANAERAEQQAQIAGVNAERAEQQAAIAGANEAEAKRQQQRAERSLSVMRDAVDKFWINQVSEAALSSGFLLNGTSGQDLERMLLVASLTFYNRIVNSQDHIDFDKSEMARFYTGIGIVHFLHTRLSQGSGSLVGTWENKLHLNQAVAAYRKAVGVDPNYAPAQFWLGAVLNEDGQFDAAIAPLRKAVELAPRSSPAQNMLGWALASRGRVDEAIPILRKAVELDSRYSMAQNNLGWVLNVTGRYDEAIPVLRRAIELDPTNALAYYNLGGALNGTGRYSEAIPILRKAIELNPKNAYPYSNLGLALVAEGLYAQAEPALRGSLALLRKVDRPDSPTLANDLALLGMSLMKQEKWSEAEPVLRECLAIREKVVPGTWQRFATMSSLGGALLGQGRYAEAEPLIIAGYEGMKAREATISPAGRPRLPEAADRIVRLYEAWSKPDKAAGWRVKLGVDELPADVFAGP